MAAVYQELSVWCRLEMIVYHAVEPRVLHRTLYRARRDMLVGGHLQLDLCNRCSRLKALGTSSGA